MHQWNVIVTDDSPYTMCYIFLAFLIYSYYKKPYRILCGFYILSSLFFLVGVHEPEVQAWITYKIAVGLGMMIGEVVKQEVTPSYAYAHIVVVVFGILPLGPTYIIFPLLFSAMATISGYKRMSLYAITSLTLISVLSVYVGAAPLMALCISVVGLMPFVFFCELFPKDVPFDEV